MPAGPLPVATGKPPADWEGFTLGTRLFPERVVQLAKEKNWSRADLAKHADVNQGTISKWLNYKVAQPERASVGRLEKKAGLPDGHLTRDPEKGTASIEQRDTQRLKDWATRIGIDETITATLGDQELGAAMLGFRPEIQRAILGLVHVYGMPLEQAAKHAAAFVKDHDTDVGAKHATAQWWFRELADTRPRHQESGTHPSSGSIKTARG